VLTRLYAYAVVAQKAVDSPAVPTGGALALTGPLGEVVEQATRQAPQRNWLGVRLNVDTSDSSRSHPVRNAAIILAFGTSSEANSAATEVAARLSGFMDQRMKGCLLAIAVDKRDGGREVTLWTFPRDEALRLNASGGAAPSVEVLQDAFSRRSNLRKAAVLGGADGGPTSFLTARVADLQTGGTGQTADYWIHDFLEAALSLAAGTGSRALARALKDAWDDAADEDERDQYYSAAIAARASTATRTSLTSFANGYLTGTAKARFLGTKDAREHRARQFAFDRQAFDSIANFRVLRTENGLRISAPFAAADDLLEFQDAADGSGREVVARGTVVDDKVSARA